MTTPPTDRQLTQLRVAFARHGINRRLDVLRLAAEAVGRHLYSTRAMTGDEVDALIARLAGVTVGALPSHAARLEREDEERARRAAAVARIPAGTILCGGRGEPTTGDLEAVAEFAEFLTAAGPPGDDPFAPAIAVLRAHGMLADDGDNAPAGDNGDVLPATA